jgi:hypothetical protein
MHEPSPSLSCLISTSYAKRPPFKTIKTYPMRCEADPARVALEAAGVPVLVVGIGVGMEGGASGVQLLVPDERIAAAPMVLADG